MLTALLTRFRRDPVQTTILLSVLITHVLFLLVILISPQFAPRKKEHKPLIVKTIIPKSAAKTAAVEKKSIPSNLKPKAATPLPQKPQVKKQEQPKPKLEPKKEAPRAPVKKQAPVVKKEPAIADKTLSKVKPAEPKKTPPRAKISDSLLQELEESIAKIENKSDKTKLSQSAHAGKAVLAPIALQIDAVASEDESDYTSALVNHLHQALSLPDYGEVKIQLSLRQDGTVAKVIVLKTQSERNRHYLESNLPRLKFPRFDGAYANKKESTFVLTFCNEL